MAAKDILVFFLYILGNVGISVYLARKINDSNDYFAAGNQSSWWLSGLSAFMTMFSAGTFVVWGGIAFKAGFVAVTISTCLGVSALFVGYYLAGKWRKLGVSSAAEFITIRFGTWALNLYTWFNIVVRLLGMAVALYSLAVVLQAIVPAHWNEWFIANLGLSAVNAIIIFCGIVIILYTIFGGLWAVLLTDVLQFIILMVAVITVIPLSFIKMGGVSEFISKVPDNFFQPVNQEFTWVFMAAWVVIHMFKIGGEWAFVQRYVCVTSDNEAKKAMYLFGVLYLISPFIWMLPPMIYRVIDPSANFEQAYVLACKFALPEGLLGLMVASMFAATVSMVNSELNVYAGVLTKDFYKRLFAQATEKSQVFVGRLLTFFLGGLVTWLAIMVPHMGGAEDIVLSITSLVGSVMVLPVIWGVFSSKINEKGVFMVFIIGTSILLFIKYGFLTKTGWFVPEEPSDFFKWVGTYSRTIEAVLGALVPLLLLSMMELLIKEDSEKYIPINEIKEDQSPKEASLFPAKIMAIAVGVLAAIVGILAITAHKDIKEQWILAGILIVICGFIWISTKRIENKRTATAK